MSQGFRDRVRNTQYLWDTLTEDEKQNPMDWCPVSDQVFKEMYPNITNIDAKIEQMSNDEFRSFFEAVMRRYRARKRRRQVAINYANQEGRSDVAEELEKEQAKDDAEVAEIAQEELIAC